jgi:coenzyme F420-reducing hydrogenase beta subunit
MIEIEDKKQCCGCRACVQICPQQCITMKKDSEGFYYPQVDVITCIKCGLCDQVCPLLSPGDKKLPTKVYAARCSNDVIRNDSSSGGVFYTLAAQVIHQGGVVFGAIFDAYWNVYMGYAESIDGITQMMGSKYVQADVNDSYKQAKVFLQQGRFVLYSGSPCQIAGLKKFLRKDYEHLITLDFLCHGVPSPGVWQRYLQEIVSNAAFNSDLEKNSVLSFSLNSMSLIKDIEFRNKSLHGWKNFSFVVRLNSTIKSDQNSVLLSDIHYKNPYIRGFLNDLYLRPSCYNCMCKNGRNESDITIGDYWGVDEYVHGFDDDKGSSVVLVYTSKGYKMLQTIDLIKRSSKLEYVQRWNAGFWEQTKPHSNRKQFFELIAHGTTIGEAIDLCLKQSICQKLKIKFKESVKRLMKCFTSYGVKC